MTDRAGKLSVSRGVVSRVGILTGMLVFLILLFNIRAADEPVKWPVLADGKTELKPTLNTLPYPVGVVVDAEGWDCILTRGEGIGKGGVLKLSEALARTSTLIKGLNQPTAIVAAKDGFFVADGNRVLHVDPKGNETVFVGEPAFPNRGVTLNDLDIDETGTLYATATIAGPKDTNVGVVYRITPTRHVEEVSTSRRQYPLMPNHLRTPGGIRLDGKSFAYITDKESGNLIHLRLSDGFPTLVAAGIAPGGGGLVLDRNGRLYISDTRNGRLLVIPRPGSAPVTVATGFSEPRGLALSVFGKGILVADAKAGAIYSVPGAPVDNTPLPVEPKVAFPDLQWEGWTGESATGKIIPHRPVVLTHAGDGSDRVFVGTQQGVLHVFPNDQKAKKTKKFLDLQDRVKYSDASNEEGFLGLAFSPKYKEDRSFYVFYTPKKGNNINHVSRFKASADNPDKADPASEEILLSIEKPFWNHDGGTLAFGPDGYLYIAIGDGGAGNDPFNNGQNLNTLLGKILRIDVSKKGDGKPYAIPADNPFTKVARAKPEIWAYGLRNVWRMSFDRDTGRLWAADVGQNLWEEIDHIERGGNYGWSLREGLHSFGPGGSGPRSDLIDPIWEYHHDVGKSITGGHVYRGTKTPALKGLYLHGDYVAGKIWGLKYDDKLKRVTANHVLRPGGFPIYSFGEDEKGEVYFLTSTTTGQGIHTFVEKGK
jgi:glucose/arabinose dehydrogenase/sugar lactone lactonase YvrE